MASLAVTTSKSPEQKKPAYMQVQTLREEKVELVGQVRNLRDEVTGLSASLAMGEAQRTELNSQRLELTQQLGASRAEQAILESTLSSVRDESVGWKARAEHGEEERGRFVRMAEEERRRFMETADMERFRVQERCIMAEAARATAHETLVVEQSERRAAEEAAKRSASEANAERARLESQKQELVEARSRLQEQLSAGVVEQRRLSDEISRLREAHEAERSAHERCREEAAHARETFEAERAAHARGREQAESERAVLRGEMDQSARRCAELEARLDTSQGEKAAAERQLASTRAALDHEKEGRLTERTAAQAAHTAFEQKLEAVAARGSSTRLTTLISPGALGVPRLARLAWYAPVGDRLLAARGLAPAGGRPARAVRLLRRRRARTLRALGPGGDPLLARGEGARRASALHSARRGSGRRGGRRRLLLRRLRDRQFGRRGRQLGRRVRLKLHLAQQLEQRLLLPAEEDGGLPGARGCEDDADGGGRPLAGRALLVEPPLADHMVLGLRAGCALVRAEPEQLEGVGQHRVRQRACPLRAREHVDGLAAVGQLDLREDDTRGAAGEEQPAELVAVALPVPGLTEHLGVLGGARVQQREHRGH